MKRTAGFLLALALIAGPPAGAEAQPGQRRGSDIPLSTRIDGPGDYRFAFRHDGIERQYRVHVPPGAQQAAPLILAFHGGGGDMDHMARDDLYGLITKSDQAGFVIVFPAGLSPLRSGKFGTWNAGKCCGRSRDENVDDVGYTAAVIDRISAQISIDRRRVFAIGMSNGAMMAYRLACEMPERLRGIMAVAGTDNTKSCRPSQAVAVLHIHARNDDHVLFNGGMGPAVRDPAKVTAFVSVPDSTAKWIALNNADPVARRVLSRPGAACELHAARAGGAPVELCITETGGHSWPGGKKPRAGEPPSQAIRANDVMWDFFSQL